MISIPVELANKYGIKPGFTFDWKPGRNSEEIAVRVIPDRKTLARRLKGAGKIFSPDRDSVSELIAERESE
ncbi:MAG: hypothetical protein IAE94_13800 [Chthoniobacterales bacterium]|nr:hypothetical protein [Chthoniobacterales bacterium]